MRTKFNYYDIIKSAIVSDKTTKLLLKNQYTFIVDRYSDKNLIRNAVENLFKVKVIKVNTIREKYQLKRSKKYIEIKKAIITLDKNSSISILLNMSKEG
ncbi:ribosomal protein L23 (chloroplast) [Galdieria partita]|uniref:Large ribosomal subunit protein uL23c n=1 Tax=Galdieria partita TaxID=83374 RepID=A0A9C7F5C5_9RHOD|nr:ribosomal protein L23 [Galdieria partita]